MNLSDQLADITTTRQINLARYDASMRARVLSLLEDVAADIQEKLMMSKEWTTFSADRLKKQLKDIREIIDGYYADISALTVGELKDLSVVEATWQRDVINKLVGVDLLSSMPTIGVLKELAGTSLIQGAIQKDWWARQGQDTQFRFLTAMRSGISQGETNRQLTGRIKGFMGVSQRNATALVRTSVQTVSAAARRATLQANSDVIKGIQQISTLDSRTSEICMAYSGASWDLDLKPIKGNKLPYNSGVPRHWNCRSSEIPITKTFRELSLDADEFKPSTRASMDGQVAANISFDDWLIKKSPEIQNELLGNGKADLFREGKISLTDLVDGKGNPLTLEQLRKRI